MPNIVVNRSIQLAGRVIRGTEKTLTTGPSDHGHGPQTFALAQVNKLISMAWAIAKMRGFGMVATENCTLYTNAPSTGTPAQTFALKANEPFIWYQGGPDANPITVDVTALYLTTPTAGTTFTISVGLDLSA